MAALLRTGLSVKGWLSVQDWLSRERERERERERKKARERERESEREREKARESERERERTRESERDRKNARHEARDKELETLYRINRPWNGRVCASVCVCGSRGSVATGVTLGEAPPLGVACAFGRKGHPGVAAAQSAPVTISLSSPGLLRLARRRRGTAARHPLGLGSVPVCEHERDRLRALPLWLMFVTHTGARRDSSASHFGGGGLPQGTPLVYAACPCVIT